MNDGFIEVTMTQTDPVIRSLRHLADLLAAGRVEYSSGALLIQPIGETIEVRGDLTLRYTGKAN